MNLKLNPCPCCKTNKYVVVIEDVGLVGCTRFRAGCINMNCGTNPIGDFGWLTREEAARAWNDKKLSPVERLRQWFAKHCNGEREHMNGVFIKTTDNPGWWVEIELEGTPCADMPSPGPGDLKRDGISFAIADMTLHGYDEGIHGPEHVVRVLMDIIDEYESAKATQ